MISPDFVRTLARYNSWQNRSLYAAADTLSDAARRQDRGAFFGSIHGTLSHILWGDHMWMNKFAGTPLPGASSIPESSDWLQGWQDLTAARVAFDETIDDWAETVTPDWLGGELGWHSLAVGKDVTKPISLLVTHMFNHQTHHRGQVHAMLTSAGALPDDTDLFAMP